MGDQKIMCTPTDWDTTLVPGSEARTAACGHEVWVAPSSIKMMEEDDIAIYCIPCAVTSDDFVESLRAHGVTLRDEQRQELNEVLGVGLTDQIAAELERFPKSPKEGTDVHETP